MLQKKGFISYLILTVITLGIYNLYFWYKYTKDINILCQSDGEETPSFVFAILLGIITLGIYYIYYYYRIENRLKNNAEENNVTIKGSKKIILVLLILNYFTFTLAGFIAQYILVRSFNELSEVYNNKHA